MRDTYTFEKDLTIKNGRFYIDLDLDPEELQAIGHVTAQWAFLEFHILEYTKLVSAHVLKKPLPKEAESDSLRKRKRTWESVVNLAFKDDKEILTRLLKIIERVGNLQGDRQKLIHGLAQWDKKDKTRLNIYSRANPRDIPWNVDAKKIEELARKIATLNSDFLNIHNENPDYPDILNRGPSSQRRPGKPVLAEIGPEYYKNLKQILAILKRQNNHLKTNHVFRCVALSRRWIVPFVCFVIHIILAIVAPGLSGWERLSRRAKRCPRRHLQPLIRENPHALPHHFIRGKLRLLQT